MNALNPEAWDAFVRAHPDATFFHLAAWRGVAHDVFGHRAHYLSLEQDGELAAVLPLVEVNSRLFGHALISNAFCVGGGPLARNEAARLAILEKAEALGRQLEVDYIELRDTSDAPGWIRRDDLYATFEGPIPASLKETPRRHTLKKVLKNGLVPTLDTTIDTFYPHYALSMRNHGTPALPRRYFERLQTAFGKDCEILSVQRDGRPIGSVLSYYFRDRVTVYYICGTPEARTLGAHDVMYWSVMRIAAERGYRTFDFGRSKLGSGPYKFKSYWGFTPRPVANQYRLVRARALPNLNPTNPRYALMIQAWQRLPLPVANAISPFLSRSLA